MVVWHQVATLVQSPELTGTDRTLYLSELFSAHRTQDTSLIIGTTVAHAFWQHRCILFSRNISLVSLLCNQKNKVGFKSFFTFSDA